MERTFNVDWDSLHTINTLSSVLGNRRRELRMRGVKHFEINDSAVFSALMKVWNTDISSIYCGLNLSVEKKFYVYAHLDPSKEINVLASAHQAFAGSLGMSHFPFYVGKGIGDRYKQVQRNETHRKIVQRLRKENLSVSTVKLEDELTEAEALSKEAKLIDIFGLLVYGGWLTNLDEGMGFKERQKLYGVDSCVLLTAKDEKIARLLDRGRLRKETGIGVWDSVKRQRSFFRPQEQKKLNSLVGAETALKLMGSV